MKRRWPITQMCEALEASRSKGFSCNRSAKQTGHGSTRFHSDEALLAHMRAIHAQISGDFYWPRMHEELLANGLWVGKKRVRQLMQRHGVRAKGKRKLVVTTDRLNTLPRATHNWRAPLEVFVQTLTSSHKPSI